MLFLLNLGLSFGFLIGIIKPYQDMKTEEKQLSIIVYCLISLSGILWLVFYFANKKQSRKEEKYSKLEYLEELKERNTLSEEDFIKEKLKILEN